jgi:predicted esterase
VGPVVGPPGTEAAPATDSSEAGSADTGSAPVPGSPAVGSSAPSAPSVEPLVLTVEDPIRDRSFAVEVRVPSGDGPFRIVMFSHGLGTTPTTYAALLDRIVAAGFLVAAPVFPGSAMGAANIDPDDVVNQPGDVTAALTRVLEEPELADRIDVDRVVAIGHAEGAITTVGLFDACCRDDRITGAVVLAGNASSSSEPFAGAGVPILFIHGDADTVVPFRTGEQAFVSDPWPKARLTLGGAGHVTPYVDGADPEFDRVATAVTDFLHWTLGEDEDGLEALRRREGAALDDQFG